MALEDYNSLLVEHLQDLLAAADLADADGVAEYLEKLRVEGFEADDLAIAVALQEDGQLDKLQEWAGEQIMRLSPDENPFAEGMFDDFDIDDAFLDLEDTGFREPSEAIDPSELLGELEEVDGIEVLDEVSLSSTPDADSEQSDAADSAVQRPNRPHVLSGKFNLVDPSKVEADREARSFSESLDAAAAADADEDEVNPDKQTRPNVTPDLGGIRGGSSDEQPFDSGESKVRYQADEPAPPLHRLPASSEISGEIVTTPPELTDDDSPNGEAFRSVSEGSLGSDSDADGPPSDEFSIEILEEALPVEDSSAASEGEVKLHGGSGFDFGFDDDELLIEESESDAASKPADDDGLEFDLGLTNPDGDAAETRPGPNDASTTKPGPDAETAERDRDLTPLRQLPAQDPEDMFFELAEALAAESSAAEPDPQYRGEPLRAHSAETNPFGNDAPTGTQHPPLPAQSVNAAAESHVQTNMNAILLEARRLRSAGELGAALDITKKVLSRGPNADAESLLAEIESQVESVHLEKLGDLSQTPTLSVDMNNLADLDLDHRAGYIISQVDGLMTFEDLIELSGMSRLETLDVFCDLVDQGVIDVS